MSRVNFFLAAEHGMQVIHSFKICRERHTQMYLASLSQPGRSIVELWQAKLEPLFTWELIVDQGRSWDKVE